MLGMRGVGQKPQHERSCTSILRGIPPLPNPGTMLSTHTHVRGPCPECAPCFLPARPPGMPGAVQHGAWRLAPPLSQITPEASRTRAPHVQAPRLPRTPTLRGAHATPSWRRVCTRRHPSPRAASEATRSDAPTPPPAHGPLPPRGTSALRGAVTSKAGWGWATGAPPASPVAARGASCPVALVRDTFGRRPARSGMGNGWRWRCACACWHVWRAWRCWG
jgi:hypothetical protein